MNKAKAILLFLVVLASGLLGWTISNQLATASESKRIDAQEIRLFDKTGTVRAYIGVNEMGVGLTLNNSSGKNALTMLVNDITGGTIITLNNRAILTVNKIGPSLTFRDDEGRLRAAIGAVKFRDLASGIRPESSIVLYDENRTLLFRAP